jgi:hypothetical protein
MKLILAWQKPDTRRWLNVGILSEDSGEYIFQYTDEAKKEQITPFGQMTDLNATYKSEAIFPLFANRLLSKSRPEYKDYIKWLAFDGEESINPIEELSRSGGIRATDSLQVFPVPEKDGNGKYKAFFFSHGIRYLPENYIERVARLEIGEKLFLMQDSQNASDKYAIAIRTDDKPELLGYCPAFFAKDFGKLLQMCQPKDIEVKVVKVNMDAPIQYRLLCRLEAPWPEAFEPFS